MMVSPADSAVIVISTIPRALTFFTPENIAEGLNLPLVPTVGKVPEFLKRLFVYQH